MMYFNNVVKQYAKAVVEGFVFGETLLGGMVIVAVGISAKNTSLTIVGLSTIACAGMMLFDRK